MASLLILISFIQTFLSPVHGDKELTDALNKIVVDASYTAPESQWEIRGEQVSIALNNYLANGKDRKSEWFARVLSEFSTQPIEKIREFQETLNETN